MPEPEEETLLHGMSRSMQSALGIYTPLRACEEDEEASQYFAVRKKRSKKGLLNQFRGKAKTGYVRKDSL